MKRLTTLIASFAIIALIFSSCSKDDPALTNAPEPEPQLKKMPAIWGDCEAFATIATPSNFKPTAGNFDELYNGANFKDGLGAVSESVPGDTDYNGGRWHVNTLKSSVDPDKYNDVCSVEDIDMSDFESTTTYFECPMRPIRGNSGN